MADLLTGMAQMAHVTSVFIVEQQLLSLHTAVDWLCCAVLLVLVPHVAF